MRLCEARSPAAAAAVLSRAAETAIMLLRCVGLCSSLINSSWRATFSSHAFSRDWGVGKIRQGGGGAAER
jgi:hypothetical protein